MELSAFSFNSIQNARTIAILAKRDGITSVEALLGFLDRKITDEARLRRLGKGSKSNINDFDYTTSTKEQKKIYNEQRSMQASIAKEMAKKLQDSTPCPDCDMGRVIVEWREGVEVAFCTYPEMFGQVVKFESGCGWSKVVK